MSCKKTVETQNSSNNTTKSDEENSCLDSDFKIYKETAYMWEKSWANTYRVATSAQVKFSYDSIKKLRGLSLSSQGVRIYYCLMNDTDTLPSLAMVNINNCADQVTCSDGNCILFSKLGTDQEEYFIDEKTLSNYRGRWQTFIDSKGEIHTPVYAYNYEWRSIEDMIDESSEDPGVWIKYGLRTITPSELTEFEQDTIRSDGYIITGSIVYCNITYGQSPRIRAKSRETSVDSTEVNELFDFAKPCPRYCN
jgi:hypothetical protein